METLDTKLIEQTLKLMSFESFFQSDRICEFVKRAYRECVPLEVFIQPASMSGKYHPKYSLGVGGLLRHIKASMVLAKGLLPLYHFTASDADYMLAALALHDIAKPDKLHPLMVEPLLDPLKEEYYGEIERIIPLIESHMGQWDQFGKLPQPKSSMQSFVHLCDYLASRSYIIVDIDER